MAEIMEWLNGLEWYIPYIAGAVSIIVLWLMFKRMIHRMKAFIILIVILAIIGGGFYLMFGL